MGEFGCTTLPCIRQIFGLALVPSHCQTSPRASPSSEQIRAWRGMDRHNLRQRHQCPAKARLLSTTRLALIALHLLPSCSSAPPQRLESSSCCRVQQLPLCSRQGQAAAAGSGCSWVSPCQDLTLVAGLAAHVAPQVSPLPAACLVGKLNGMSEINLFPFLKQPGNVCFYLDGEIRGWTNTVRGIQLRFGVPEKGLEYAGQNENGQGVAGFDPAPGRGVQSRATSFLLWAKVVQQRGQQGAGETWGWWEDGEAEESPSPGPLTVTGPKRNVASAIPLRQDDDYDGCPDHSHLLTAGTTESARAAGRSQGTHGRIPFPPLPPE